MKLFSKIVLAAILANLATLVSGDEITLYSHRHYDSDRDLYAAFTKKSGIKVNVVKASADELIERLKAEGENSKADILMTVDAGRLQRAKAAGLLQSIESKVLKDRIPASYRDPENQWFGLSVRARVIVYAADRVKPSELSTYENLASPSWRGRLLARSSSNIYNQSIMASIIAQHGVNDARDWAAAVRGNMARPPQGNDRDQIRAVAAGLGDAALVNTYYVGLLINSSNAKDREIGNSVSLFFPNQKDRGTPVNVSGAGIAKASKNPEGAIKFLEFLASKEAQSTFPQATYEYPVSTDVPWSNLQKTWGEFKPDTLNLGMLGELNEAAATVFNESGWE
ncbi:MAG: Fe(3+) ABC transporter substrate-binding protein [Verrucomicrobiota bacterium]